MTTPPRLVIRDTDGSERTVELRDGVMRIGRSADNEIVLGDASKGVSRAHAELHVDNGRCTIVDLHSQNGTWINALRVQRAEVRPDAEIAIGLYRLRLQVGPVLAQTARRDPGSRPTDPATVVARAATTEPMPTPHPAPHAVAAPPPVVGPPPLTDLPLWRGEAAVTSPVPMPPIAPGPMRAAGPAPAAPARRGSKLPFVIGAVAAVAVITLAVTLYLINNGAT